MESSSKQYEVFKVERGDRDGIAVITLNSPKTLNAFTWNFPEDLHNALTEISDDAKIKVVVMKAEGKIFSAGAGMDTMKVADTPFKVKTYMANLNKAIKKMYDMPQPIICAIDGTGAGGGANLALSSDFVIASESAKFANVFVNLGIIPDTGGLWNICRLTGPMRAKEIAMRGLTIGAEEALKYGLVTKVVSSAELNDEVMSFAKELASKPMLTLQSIKRICNKMPEMTHDTYCEIEEGLMSILFFTKDHREGVNAFLQKRRPDFQGEDEF
ncbi:MAG: enoyl-CoA hydratase/isomerase family protein [Syntrophales bacterium]